MWKLNKFNGLFYLSAFFFIIDFASRSYIWAGLMLICMFYYKIRLLKKDDKQEEKAKDNE